MLTPLKESIIELMDDDALWQAILAKADEITEQHRTEGTSRGGHSRSAALYGHRYVASMVDIELLDGSHAAYWIEASYWPGLPAKKRIEVKVQRYFHSAEDYWESQIASEPERRVVVNGVHYRLGKNGDRRGEYNGFGGRRFDIEYLEDGRVITTYDLWYQGQIPPKFREQLPDNARWAKFIETVP